MVTLLVLLKVSTLKQEHRPSHHHSHLSCYKLSSRQVKDSPGLRPIPQFLLCNIRHNSSHTGRTNLPAMLYPTLDLMLRHSSCPKIPGVPLLTSQPKLQ